MGSLIVAIVRAIKGLSDTARLKENQLSNSVIDATDIFNAVRSRDSTSRSPQQNIAKMYDKAVSAIAGSDFSSAGNSNLNHSVLFSHND